MKINLILSTFYQVLTIITPIFTAPYVSRVLGPDGVGIYSYTNSIVMYFTMFAALGTVSYGAREIAQHRDDIEQYSKLFWEIECLTIITSVICLLIWVLWCFFNTLYKIYYLILSISLLSTMFDISWFYTGLEKFQYTILQNSFFKLLSILAIFVFVNAKNDLWIYIAIMSASTLFGNLSMWLYLPRFLKRVPIKSLNILPHFKETLIYFIPTIASSIYTVLDKTLLGVITQNEFENGYYEQATKIINIAKSVTFSGLNSVFGSRISWLFSQKKYDEVKIMINNSINYILFMGFGICFGILGIANNFIPLFFGPGYDKTIILLKLMCPLILIIGISNCLGAQYYTPSGLRALSAKFLIIGSFVNLILNLILIPKAESIGAVIATIIAEGVITILYLSHCDGYIQTKVLLLKSWKKVTSGMIMMLFISIIGNSNNTVIGLMLQIICGFSIYTITLFILKDSIISEVIIPLLHKNMKK